MAASFFFLGNLISALAIYVKLMWLLYIGYGVVGGIGVGIRYILAKGRKVLFSNSNFDFQYMKLCNTSSSFTKMVSSSSWTGRRFRCMRLRWWKYSNWKSYTAVNRLSRTAANVRSVGILLFHFHDVNCTFVSCSTARIFSFC